MTLSPKVLLLIVSLSALVGGALVLQFATREVIHTQVVEKVVTVDTAITKDHDVTTTKEIIRPDGTKEIDTVKTEDTVSSEVKTVTDNKKTDITDTKGAAAKDWFVSVGAALAPWGVGTYPSTYHLEVSRRILGPLAVGVWGTLGGGRDLGGISVGVEF